MSTNYTGFDTYIPPAYTATFGRFISGNATDDGDLDDAAHLMPLPMATMDDAQWLGWRVGYLNPVEGSTGNAALTATITNYNTWVFKRFVTMAPGAALNLYGIGIIGDAAGGLATLYVGKTGFGIGHILVGTDSDITIQGTSGHHGQILVPTFGEIVIQSGGSFSTQVGGNAVLQGDTTQRGAYTKSGAGAYVSNRAVLLPAHGPGGPTDPNLTIDGADADIFTLASDITALGQPMVITVAANAAAGGHRFVIRASSTSPGFNTVIQKAGPTQIGAFYQTSVASNYIGGAIEFYYSAGGVPTRLFVNTGVDVNNPNPANSLASA